MLTSDLVRTRRREGVLHAQYVMGDARLRVLPIARAYLDLYKRMIGCAREDLDAALDAVEVSARDRVAALGVRKVLDDQCVYEGPSGVDPEEVRREVFLRAAAAWKGLDVRDGLDREAILVAAGEKLGKSPSEIEASLYADLRGAEILRSVWDLGADALIERYNVALAQSILLRATRVTVTVQGESPDRYRRLFRTMRFLGLLYTVTLHDEGAPPVALTAPGSGGATVVRKRPRAASGRAAKEAETAAKEAETAASGRAAAKGGEKAPGAAAVKEAETAASGRGAEKGEETVAPGPVTAKEGASARSKKITKAAKTKAPGTDAKAGSKAASKAGSKGASKEASREGDAVSFSRDRGRAVAPGPSPKAVYSIVIDGPFSLFGASLKYGLRLATLLHAVLACARFSLVADVVWGPRKEAVVFRVSPGDGLVPHAGELPSSSPVLEAFVAGFEKLGSAWSVAENDRIFVVPGEPAVIPDLSFVNGKTGEEVLLEAFGFWSRAAVWTRVEQIRRGALPARLLLAVSKELRVSSEVLEDDDAGEVYVYKATMLPRAVLERLEKRGKAA